MSTSMVARAALLLALSAALAVMVSVVSAAEARADSCVAEDGSTIENCDTYFQPAPTTSDDGWLVLHWNYGQKDVCADYVSDSDKSAARALAVSYNAQGYAAAAVHYTDSLYTKTPSCGGGYSTYSPLSSQQSTPCSQDPKCWSEQARIQNDYDVVSELEATDTQDVKGCFTIDAHDLDTVGKRVFTQLGFHGDPSDWREQLYSPDCFNGKEVWELDSSFVDQLREDPCYDVVGDTPNLEDAVVEFVGCPSELDRIATTQAKQAGYTGKSVQPISQQEGPIAQPGGTGPTAAKTAELIAKSNAMLKATPQYAPKNKGA